MSRRSQTTPIAGIVLAITGVVAAVTLAPLVAGHGYFAWFASHATGLASILFAGTLLAIVVCAFSENSTGRFSPVAIGAAVVCCGCGAYAAFLGGGEVMAGTHTLLQAGKVARGAAANIGASAGQTEVEKRLAVDASSWAAYTRDRAFVESVANATTRRDRILEWLGGAHEFGVDGRDVAARGMVTPDDESRLFRQAMKMSAMGDRTAIAWVELHHQGRAD